MKPTITSSQYALLEFDLEMERESPSYERKEHLVLLIGVLEEELMLLAQLSERRAFMCDMLGVVTNP